MTTAPAIPAASLVKASRYIARCILPDGTTHTQKGGAGSPVPKYAVAWHYPAGQGFPEAWKVRYFAHQAAADSHSMQQKPDNGATPDSCTVLLVTAEIHPLLPSARDIRATLQVWHDENVRYAALLQDNLRGYMAAGDHGAKEATFRAIGAMSAQLATLADVLALFDAP